MVPIKWVTHAGLTNSSCGRGNKSPRIENQWKNHFFKMKGEDSGIGQSAKRSGLTAKMHKAT